MIPQNFSKLKLFSLLKGIKPALLKLKLKEWIRREIVDDDPWDDDPWKNDRWKDDSWDTEVRMSESEPSHLLEANPTENLTKSIPENSPSQHLKTTRAE